MSKRVTLHDVATELGISPSTVSRVLNNSILISDEVRRQILETVDRLGYQRTTNKRHESRTILNIRLFLPYREDSDLNIYYAIAGLITGIRQGLQAKVNIIVDLNQEDLGMFDNKKSAYIDGCIFAFTNPRAKLLSALDERGLPVILLNRPNAGHSSVEFDNEGGMMKLVHAMAERAGRKHLMYLGFSAVKDLSDLRRQGVARGCAELGIPFGPKDSMGVRSISEIDGSLVDSLLDKGVDGVLCFNDNLALSLMMASLLKGVSIPDVFSLSGFDDSPVLRLFSKQIDTIRFSYQSFGYHAGIWLRRAIIEKQCEHQRIIIGGEYISGQTIVS